MRFPVNRARLGAEVALAALMFLGAGVAIASERSEPAPAAPTNGPAADYPVVVGEPFTIGTTVWTPSDQLNYDAVGEAGVAVPGDPALVGVSVAHKTLPLPSYAEVTSLDTGRTILVRVTTRGPMINDVLVELSADAATQLGIVAGSHAPIRIRRVNPPEQERAMLRSGAKAPERMATPEGLLKVLRRKLADQSPLLPPPSTPPRMPTQVPADELSKAPVYAPKPANVDKLAVPAKPLLPAKAAASDMSPAPAGGVKAKSKAAVATAAQTAGSSPAPVSSASRLPAAPVGKMPVTAKPLVPDKPATPRAIPVAKAPEPPHGALVVQVGTFSSGPNARALAAKLGGQAVAAGKFWRVRMGPYASREAAAPALEKAKRAGYSDARIQSVD